MNQFALFQDSRKMRINQPVIETNQTHIYHVTKMLKDVRFPDYVLSQKKVDGVYDADNGRDQCLIKSGKWNKSWSLGILGRKWCL